MACGQFHIAKLVIETWWRFTACRCGVSMHGCAPGCVQPLPSEHCGCRDVSGLMLLDTICSHDTKIMARQA